MASTEEIRADLAEIVNDVAGVAVEDVQLDKSFTDDLDVDSLSMVEIIYACEEKFGVSIPDEDAKNLNTVGDAVAFIERAQSGLLWEHVWASVSRVLTGFGIAFVVSIPVAFLMAWYDPFRHVVEPWIQFIRNIPPLAYVFLIIAALGIGQTSKITVIFIAAFLVMVITIYQGVKGVDVTLIKAARVLGATQKDIFFKVTIPASTPFILVAARLGLSTSLTTLMASEIVGGDKGIGMMIQQASGYYQMDVVLLGIIMLGIIGICFEKIVRFLERRFTGWQETIQQ